MTLYSDYPITLCVATYYAYRLSNHALCSYILYIQITQTNNYTIFQNANINGVYALNSKIPSNYFVVIKNRFKCLFFIKIF